MLSPPTAARIVSASADPAAATAVKGSLKGWAGLDFDGERS